MADSNKPSFSFGTPATGAPASGGLFGASATPQQPNKPLFGAVTPGKSLFGGNSTGTTPGGLFGGAAAANNTPATSSGGLFGGASTATTGGFKFNTGAAGSTPSTGPSLFGNTSTAKATPATTATTTPTTGPSLFGGATATPSTPSLFGAKPAASGPSLFGNNTATAAATPAVPDKNSVFTQGMAAQSSTPGGLFQNLGKTSATDTPAAKPLSSMSFTPAGNPAATGTGLFGAAAQPPAAPSGLFGAKPSENKLPPFGNAAPTGKGLFGEVKPADTASNPAAPSLFAGATQPTTSVPITQTTPPAPAGLFANPSKPAEQAPASGTTPFAGFAAKKDTPASTAAASGGLFAAKPATTAPPTGGLFSAPATTTASSGAGLFSGSTANTTTTSAPTAGGLFGAASSSAQPATSTATSGPAMGGGLFGAPTSAQPASSTAAPASGISPFGSAPAKPSTAAAPAAGASLFGASTGNAPATSTVQQPSSRLASKSLDEIITTWSTSLATHQKTFATVAERVAKWDRQLVQNSSAIGGLYTRVFQAERDTAEVERQLSTVEASQRELEARLEKYESEVDGMLESAGLSDEGAAGGVDAERERTYHAAQEAQIRLTDMSHGLTSMIEEINAASSKLSSTRKTDTGEDPLAQIVRMLNSHLSQLQTIDKGAAALTLKVEQAQKDAGIAANRNGLNGGREWVEGFGRSYLGRR